MTTPKFTPGPWNQWEGRTLTHTSFPIIGSECAPVCYLAVDGNSPTEHANATLIASAPDLYAALEECFTEPFAHCLVNEDKDALYRRICAINDTVRAALAKARGMKGGE